MYGLLLESFSNFIKLRWGEESWEAIRRHAKIESSAFCTHQIYSETFIPRLTSSAVEVLGIEERELFDALGVYFVDFVGQYGYDQILSLLGRHMRDFLNGLDNLHEYLKFSYPKMRAPSFLCERETAAGMILHYRSKRRGFVYYTMGQIKQVAKRFYDTEVKINILTQEMDGNAIHVIFDLKFDNRAFIRDKTESQTLLYREEQLFPFRTSRLFELFPFCIVFSQDMVIRQIGYSLVLILKDLIGVTVTEAFEIIRPMIPITFSTILERQNNTFELMTRAPLNHDRRLAAVGDSSVKELRFRGQMLHMEDWKSVMFLCTPVMADLDSLLSSGLYINDLSLHDCSRDFVLAGTQQSVELKLALHQEQLKTRKLEDSMKKLDDEMKRTDELLYQMIPKQVADRIRRGENPVDTCEVFDAVSILFSDVVTFTEICSRITPMLVVSMLNHMYSLFDQLTERNGVYKVETIGDSYMVVSGAPNQEANHAERICDMAMDMIDASGAIFDPSREGEHLKLRVGVHSGNVVAGVVGLKMPRWCLFGDAVNTSSRMESTSEAGRIQISNRTKHLLPETYETQYRGEVIIKGKGKMKTYWLISRAGRVPANCLNYSEVTRTSSTINLYSSTLPDDDAGIQSDTLSISNNTPCTSSDSSLDTFKNLRFKTAPHTHTSFFTECPHSTGKKFMKSAKDALIKSFFPANKKGKHSMEGVDGSWSSDSKEMSPLKDNDNIIAKGNTSNVNRLDNKTIDSRESPRQSNIREQNAFAFEGAVGPSAEDALLSTPVTQIPANVMLTRQNQIVTAFLSDPTKSEEDESSDSNATMQLTTPNPFDSSSSDSIRFGSTGKPDGTAVKKAFAKEYETNQLKKIDNNQIVQKCVTSHACYLL